MWKAGWPHGYIARSTPERAPGSSPGRGHRVVLLGKTLPGVLPRMAYAYGEAPPERSTFLGLQVYKRVEISQVEVYKRVGKSVI